MHLQRVSLTNYRNYVRLEMALALGLTIIQGQNAQGKSNLLEAITYLATSKSPRTNTDNELINWLAQDDPYPFARLAADVSKEERIERVDITLLPGQGNGLRKQVRINGAPKRALDLVGLILVVLFRPEDVDLVAGAPGERRRYLDLALCQIDHAYCRALSEYNRAISQRNALLRQLVGRHDPGAQLRFWDEKLAETGGLVIARRQWLINQLENEASLRHLDLSGGYERLRLRYLPTFDPLQPPTRTLPAANPSLVSLPQEELPVDMVCTVFLAHLHAGRSRDLAAGMTQLGPHRDDLGFFLGDRNLRDFGSRGQQRTAALASKMAELTVMTRASGITPLLLLDDVMSELDASRRAMVRDLLVEAPQAIVTTTDWHPFGSNLLHRAHMWRVHAGQVQVVSEIDLPQE